MFGKIKNLIVSLLSLLVIVAGVMSVLVVLNLVTLEQLWANLSTMLQVGVIVLVCALALIMLLRVNDDSAKK